MSESLLDLVQKASVLTTQLEVERVKKDPYYFVTNFCYTIDEHDDADPYKLIPKKEYIRDLCDVFMTENLIAVEKSRQMMVSWLMVCALPLWYAMYYRPEGTRVFIMSKKEQDANAMIDRIKHIYDRIPDRIKQSNPADPFTYCKMTWSKRNSIIQGVPQGPDQLRQYTASLIISDETAFQERAEKAYEAAKPSLSGGGKYVSISTPNGKEFHYRIVKDML